MLDFNEYPAPRQAKIIDFNEALRQSDCTDQYDRLSSGERIKAIARDALFSPVPILQQLLPGGVLKGKEYVCGDLGGNKGHSCSVNTITGVWNDFALHGKETTGSDIVSLARAVLGCRTMTEAADEVLAMMGTSPSAYQSKPAAKPVEDWTPVLPIPADAPEPSFHHYKYGNPAATWMYQDRDGRPLGFIMRFEPQGERKQIVPLTYCRNGARYEWRMKSLPTPRPLYGLETIGASRMVLIVEGEKAADAARRLLGESIPVLTWPGGSKAVNKADFSPLSGMTVTVWPDNDEPGRAAADEVAEKLRSIGCDVRILAPPAGKPDGWDAADAEVEGVSGDEVQAAINEVWREEINDVVDIFDNLTTPDFPTHLLPEFIADYAKDQADLIGVDPAVIGMTAIGAAAACIDDRIKIQPKKFDPTWKESARLWVGIVGNPSAKKSPGISKAMGPLFKIDQKWRDKKPDGTFTAKDIEEDLSKPPKPEGKRLIYSDSTIEKLTDLMSKYEPRGALSYHDELSGWLASMDAYKNGAGKDRAAWLEAYNGGPKAIDRVSSGSKFVKNWSLCVIGGIQPSVVHAYANNTNHDGMLQRFILVHANNARMGADRMPEMNTIEQYGVMMERLADLLPPEEGAVVKLSDEAHEVRREIEEKIHKAIISLPNPFLTAALGKWSGLYARLLLVWHCCECVDRYQKPTDCIVKAATAQKVADLMWKCLLPHAVKFYAGLDNEADVSRELASLILSHGWERFTVKRDLDRYLWSSRRMDSDDKEAALERLETLGWIIQDGKKLNERGRPAAYIVNPKVHQMFEAYALQERERKATAREILTSMHK